MFPSNNDHSFVVRTDEFGPDMCILFELVIVLARKLSDGSVGMLCAIVHTDKIVLHILHDRIM
jgi:hypothetical protein